MSIINYAIEINTTVTGSSDATIGLTTDGYIRLITGRPGYDGTPTYPVWEDDSNNTEVWYEGLLTKSDFGNPNRQIDIEHGGNYASISGFNFSIENTMKLWKKLQDLSIDLINCDIQVYCIINNKFFYMWAGVIEDDSFDSITAQIKCTSNHRKIHKTLPPNKISTNLFPNAQPSSIGKTIPICFGNILYARIFGVSGISDEMVIDMASGLYHEGQTGIFDDDNIKTFAAINYDSEAIVGFETKIKLRIITIRKKFFTDELENKYLSVQSGANSIQDKLIQITGNAISVADSTTIEGYTYNYFYTDIYLAAQLDVVDTIFNANYVYTWADSTKDNVDEIWWFNIFSGNSQHIFSERQVNKLQVDKYDQYKLFQFNSEKETMEDVHGLITKLTVEKDRDVLNLLSTEISRDGTLTFLISHGANFLLAYNNRANFLSLPSIGNVDDFDRGTLTGDIFKGSTYNVTTASTPASPYIIENRILDIQLNDFDLRNTTEIYIGVDFQIYATCASVDALIGIGFEFLLVDVYEKMHILSTNLGVQYTYEQLLTFTSGTLHYNFLPNEYYKNNTLPIFDTESLFGYFDGDGNKVANYIKVPDELKTMIERKLLRSVRIRFKVSTDKDITISNLQLKQVGVFSFQETKTGNNSLCTTIEEGEGRNLSATPTYSVYDSIIHILENYDEIPSSAIDYYNLSTTRTKTVGWEIGRQVTEQKNSMEYLKELAEFSFVTFYQRRDNKLRINSFLDDISTVWEDFDETNIIRDSIKKFEKSSILNCFNEFKVEYGFNPCSNQFEKSLSISHVDESAFPDYYMSTKGAKTEITSPTIVGIDVYGDGSGRVIFNSDISAQLNVGDIISFIVEYNGVPSSDHVYFARVTIVSTIYVIYTDAIISNCSSSVTEVIEAIFYKHPGGIPQWLTFVEGITSYATAKYLWEICHASYLQTKVVKSQPEKLTKAYWFFDPVSFYNLNTKACPLKSAPFLYLQTLVLWMTQRKRKTEFSIPITSSNIQLELMDYVSFTHTILTNNVTLYGWITKISIDINSDTMIIQLTLLPNNPNESGLIIETGDAPDTITESGSQMDTITEGQN